MKTGLYIVATPIGNLKDITSRALETLEGVDVVACEDKRITKKLFSLLGLNIKKTFINLCDYNESAESDKIINYIKKGVSVALVSDAGSPLISDPGYKLVKKCKDEGLYVTTIPGVSAVISALQLSGLPTDRFLFAGFVPNKEKGRVDFFEELKNVRATIVCYETANRILKTLNVIKDIFNQSQVCVAREITKMYEEAITNSPEFLIEHFVNNEPKGEMVVIINQKEVENVVDIESLLRDELKTKSVKEAVAFLVKEYKLNKNEVYKKALEIKDER
ncbi:MAG: 16S rRNA (cytidine(1402)-2'-O)-methyltransferase [Alphaproteobacteria bacterium]